MSSDTDLERLMAKRLAELESAARHNAAPKQNISPRDKLISVLGHRGPEVLERAEAQFPDQVPHIVSELAKLSDSGSLGDLDGARLLSIFYMLGMRVRMPTRINIKQDGKTVSLSERIRGGKG